MTSVALIGYGGIAQDVVAALREAGGSTKIAGVCAGPDARRKRAPRLATSQSWNRWPTCWRCVPSLSLKLLDNRQWRSMDRTYCVAASICW